MRKPPHKIALHSLILGLTTSIALAWGVCLWNPECYLTCTGVARPQPCAVVRLDGPGLTIHALSRGLDNDPTELYPDLGRFRNFTYLGGVSWSGTPARHNGFLLMDGDRDAPTNLLLSPVMPARCTVAAALAAGWPLRCLGSRATLSSAGDWSRPGALPLWLEGYAGETVFGRSLPLRPLWGGFALDILVFTAAWFTLLIAPSVLRPILVRRRRRRRWCCRCGYDLRGAAGPVCPECGRAIPKRFHR